MHGHVAHSDGEAKFWLSPAIELAVVIGLSPHVVADADAVVRRHELEIRDAWTRHFGR